MLRKFQYIAHDILVFEKCVLFSADLPRDQEQTIRDFCASKIFKAQIFMSLFEGNYLLIGHFLPKESFSNIRPATNRIKTVCGANGASAKERKNQRKHRHNSFGFHCNLFPAVSTQTLDEDKLETR